MQLFEDVYTNYPATRARGGNVGNVLPTPDIAAINKGIPGLFRLLVASLETSAVDFRIYGRFGQFNVAKIPWVAICDKRVSRGATEGYYLVLLFHENMEGCFLSLNQGYTQFKDAFGSDTLALEQIEESAQRCLSHLEALPGFIAGPIDLAATGHLGIGYEQGAILSKWYPRTEFVDEGGLSKDLEYLLDQYASLITFMGPDLALGLPIAEGALQRAAASLADTKLNWTPPSGPVPVPPPVPGSKTQRYPRDAKTCALAQQRAGFQCEVDHSHQTFPRRRSGENFVESHHLVPMSLQRKFRVSLDVIENVVALCPNCHRLLHHGKRGDKRPILTKLLQARQSGLARMGIQIDGQTLVATYSNDLGEEEA